MGYSPAGNCAAVQLVFVLFFVYFIWKLCAFQFLLVLLIWPPNKSEL